METTFGSRVTHGWIMATGSGCGGTWPTHGPDRDRTRVPVDGGKRPEGKWTTDTSVGVRVETEKEKTQGSHFKSGRVP